MHRVVRSITAKLVAPHPRVAVRACSSAEKAATPAATAAAAETAAVQEGSSWTSTIVTGALAVAAGAAAYETWRQATEWPEGCEIVLAEAKESKMVQRMFGENLHHDQLGWDGEFDAERVNVYIPISGSKGKGVLHGAAVKIGPSWTVLMCEVHLLGLSASSAAEEHSRIKEQDKKQGGNVEGDQQADRSEADKAAPGYKVANVPKSHAEMVGRTYDVIGARWVSPWTRQQAMQQHLDAAAAHKQAEPTQAEPKQAEKPAQAEKPQDA